jgi:uncharacterized membrane protein YhaH (DUF805 family)
MSPIAWALEPFRRYADFRGRSRRSEFWWYSLIIATFAFVVFFIVGIVLAVSGVSSQVMSGLTTLLVVVWLFGTFLPSLAVSVRRLHDTGRSGWWTLLALIPLGGLVLLVFHFQDSQPASNKWGPNPKNVGAMAGVSDAIVQA